VTYLTQLGLVGRLWNRFNIFDCNDSTLRKQKIAAFFCNLFLRVYPSDVINDNHRRNHRENSILRDEKENPYGIKPNYILHLLAAHWRKHSKHISLSEETRSIKLSYCIWWNSWVLTSASCFSCNFLSNSPPKYLSTALLPRPPISIYKSHTPPLCYRCGFMRMLSFLFIHTNLQELRVNSI